MGVHDGFLRYREPHNAGEPACSITQHEASKNTPTKASQRGRSHRNPGRRILILAVMLGVSCLPAAGRAYRFFIDGRTDSSVVGAEHAARWAADAWGPGEELGWQVAPQSEFEVLFDAPEGVLPYVERALAAWSDLPTADILWRLDGVGGAIDEATARRDGRNTVSLHPPPNSGASGWARIWSDRSAADGVWEIHGCDVVMNAQRWAEIPEDIAPEYLEAYRENRRERSVSLFVHELGHCLGLAHAAALPTRLRFNRIQNGFQPVHPRDPAMSYGYDQETPEGLSADDVIGASLLRPARGWPDATGGISGTLYQAETGEPAPYSHVWALPVRNPLPDRTGAFSNGDGEFLVEGLQPGDYVLWAQPILERGAHPRLVSQDPPVDLDDSVFGSLVQVEAGQIHGDLRIPMVRGRTARPPPDVIMAYADPVPTTSIVGQWNTPCSGIRVRAESPFRPDAPTWFTHHSSHLRYDPWFATRVTIQWSRTARNVMLDWAGPYRNWWWSQQDKSTKLFEDELTGLDARSPVLDVSIADWQIERTGSGVRHSIEIAWPESTAAQLRFRSESNACAGEPMVVCDLSRL